MNELLADIRHRAEGWARDYDDVTAEREAGHLILMLLDRLEEAEKFAQMVLMCDTYGCENGPSKCLHADAARQIETLRAE